MTIDTEVKTLQGLPMFRGVDAAKLKLLAFTSERLNYLAEERLFSQGSSSDSAFLILSGRVRVVLEKTDSPLIVAEISAGGIVGEMGVLSGSPRSATVIAAEPTVALRIGRDVFFDLIKEFPAIAVAVMRDLAGRLEQTNARLAALQKA